MRVAAAHELGSHLMELGPMDEGLAQYREAIRIWPQVGLIHCNLGLDLSRQGKYDEAVAEYREAIRLDANDAGAGQ